MGQVAVTINARNYKIACEDGQEDHLVKLASFLDGKVGELVTAVGQIGDTRLLLMAGLLVADELFDAREDLASLRDDLAALRDGAAGDDDGDGMGDAAAAGLEALARRIDAIAAGLERT